MRKGKKHAKKIKTSRQSGGLYAKIYLQPEQVEQCPEHFLGGLPVAECIVPDQTRTAMPPQCGQTVASSGFFMRSSKQDPHWVQ